MQAIKDYIKAINAQFTSGQATEHSYRAALGDLLKELLPEVLVTNEPARVECGAPDYVLTRHKIPLGYVEAKNVDEHLDDQKHQDQFNRYRAALGNLILTNYLEFRLCQGDKTVPQVTLAQVRDHQIKPLYSNFDDFVKLIKNFGTYNTYEEQDVPSARELAKHMASKARLLANVVNGALDKKQQATAANVINETLDNNQQTAADNSLEGQFSDFKKFLIPDIKPEDFADMYAQTIAYGLFTARLYDEKQADFTDRVAEEPPANNQMRLAFSRQRAAELIPKSNPFLHRFFQHIVRIDLDERIEWIVDDLVDMFNVVNVAELMGDFGKSTQRIDPYIHFYETFLSEYDPVLRKGRGVYYTPEPVVQFIVRAVNDLLKNEFKLANGLADTSTTTIAINNQQIHRVQILDPAAGAGSFLAEVVEQIYDTQSGQRGMWADYVKQDLIPRLNGFEIMMAPYVIAHLRLAITLQEKGCQLKDRDRLHIYLTNALEEVHSAPNTQFAKWLAEESKEANQIKKDRPVMVVLGNPPYKAESQQKGEGIMNLLEVYKQEPSGQQKLQEKNPKWINDDYVKFIRLGQDYIDRNGDGILAYINNNGFLDNPTFRGMRWHLLRSFDKIYILDLHGNTRKKEKAPDGSPDKNVFDIQQGVSINLFIKTDAKKGKDVLARVFHADLFGERESKYTFLRERNLNQIKFQEIKPQLPDCFFVPKDYRLLDKYNKGFVITDLFPEHSVGITTGRDKLAIHYTTKDALRAAKDICAMEKEAFYRKYDLPPDVGDWRYEWAKKDIKQAIINNDLAKDILYRPFDLRKIIFTGQSRGFITRSRYQTMRHFLTDADNVGLISERQQAVSGTWNRIFIANKINDLHVLAGGSYCFPLYLYPEPNQHGLEIDRKPNLDKKIVAEITNRIGMQYIEEKQSNDKDSFAPIDLLDYIYAILHSPNYCQTYSEYLRIDFPRIPYPDNHDQFRALADLGAELRAFHLLEHKTLHQLITEYPKSGDHRIDRVKKNEDRVYINKTQYFAGVPGTAWNYSIGSYQPAQKYLKDRKGRALTTAEITHYQRMIIALKETEALRQKIDTVCPKW